MSRSAVAKRNIFAGIFNQLIVTIGGLILPRLILTHFGSATNGLVNSIIKYMSFTVLLYAGLGAVTRKALYKPLAEKNGQAVSEIMAATKRFMRNVSLLLAGLLVAFACIYPFLLRGQFDWLFAFALVLIIGASSLADSYFGISYRLLLQADQKHYIQTHISTITYLVSTLAAVLAVLLGQNILVVKLLTTLAFVLNPFLLYAYIKRHYQLDKHARPNNAALEQKRDAFAQQIAAMVTKNIDIILLTLFVSVKEISVYTVYYMVTNNLSRLIQAGISGMGPIFGNMMAQQEDKRMQKRFLEFEWLLFAVSTVLFAVTTVTLTSFVQVYTKNVTDINYYRPLFGFLLAGVTMLDCLRVPYQQMVEAAGHFRQTRNGAILEILLNLSFSLLFVQYFGIVGVVLGTVAATIVRNIQYSFYAIRHILKISRLHILRSYGVYGATYLVISAFYFVLPPQAGTSLLDWVFYAAATLAIALMVTALVSFLFNREQLFTFIKRLTGKYGKKTAQ